MSEKPVSGSARTHAGHVEVRITVPLESRTEAARGPAPGGPPPEPERPGEPTHSADFSCVNWYGTTYGFTHKQRLVVAALWQAREDGHEWLSQETLLDVAESDGGRLRDLFKRHPAWDVMIVSAVPYGGPAGSYRLGESR